MPLLRPSFILVALLAGASTGGHTAELPPPPTDPKLAEVFVQAKAALEKSSSPGYLDMPSDAQPWPCPVTELQVRTWADALGNDDYDDKTRKIFEASMRGGGLKPEDNKTRISNVRYVPLAATCKGGKLDGPLEFIIEYTKSIDVPNIVMETRTRSRTHLMLVNGEKSIAALQTMTSGRHPLP